MRRRIELAGTIALIGLPGSGKSTVAPLLARRLGSSWADLDDRIARTAGVPVPELLRREGEQAFRTAEEAALQAALGEAEASLEPGAPASRRDVAGGPRPGLVLACGGGIVTREGSRALLRERAFVVWLRVAAGTAAARLGAAGATDRPLLDGAETLRARIDSFERQRAPLYDAAAHASVETDRLAPDAVAAAVQRAWEARETPWDSSGS